MALSINRWVGAVTWGPTSRVTNGEQHKNVSDRVFDVVVLERTLAPNTGPIVARYGVWKEEREPVGFLDINFAGGDARHCKRGFDRREPKILCCTPELIPSGNDHAVVPTPL